MTTTPTTPDDLIRRLQGLNRAVASELWRLYRDTDPSGAASIEWFDRWVQTGDHQVKQRILEYNEDDCIATRVLLDGIRAL